MATQDRMWTETGQVRQAAREQISQATEQARGYVSDRVEQGRRMACEELDHTANALRAGAEKLREEQDAALARFAETAAQWADEGACYLREHELGELADAGRNMVRSRPEWVLGGLFVAGMALGRLLKASAPMYTSGAEDSGPSTGWAPESGEYEQPSSMRAPAAGVPSDVTGVSTF